MAVAAVRRGARAADSRASRPGTPAMSSGRPTSRARTGAKTGPSRLNPMMVNAADTPSRTMEPAPNRTAPSAAAPRTIVTTPAAVRARAPPVAGADDSRIAVTGATRAALRAGPAAAARVM